MAETQERELTEREKQLELTREEKEKEMSNVIDFLVNKVGVKTHKGILLQRSNVDYFRGVNFHVAVLQHKDKIMQMIPTFIKEGLINKLDTMDDSIRLGNMMIVTRNVVQVKGDPRIVGTANEKCPKYVVPDKNPFSEKGIYMVLEKENKQKQSFYLVLVVIAILALMCFRLWPLWLKKAIWYISFYLLVFLIVTAILRVILWGILYHFGLEFWLFPNYFIDSNDPRDSFLPVYSFEVRSDATDIKSIIFRLASGALIVYMGYQFCQDEKNIEDLKDLAEHGLTDLFEYGQEFMIGNALGDGKPKDNRTEEVYESFSQKYRRELKKDLSEIENEEEEEDTNAESAADDGAASTQEGSGDTADDEQDEYVSSKDMFEDM